MTIYKAVDFADALIKKEDPKGRSFEFEIEPVLLLDIIDTLW